MTRPSGRQEPDISFQHAVQQFTAAAAGIPSASFAEHHTSVHDMVKGRLGVGRLEEVLGAAAREVAVFLAARPEREDVSLLPFVRTMLFQSGVKAMFGADVLRGVDMTRMQREFFAYDRGFERGTKLPELLLPQWCAVRPHPSGGALPSAF